MDGDFKERLLIKKFLEEYKKVIEKRTNLPFHPRSLIILAQPELKDSTLFEWWAYNKWYDGVAMGVTNGKGINLLEIFLDIPLQILIQSEEEGRPLVSKQDGKKLIKALKLLREIKMGVQDEKN